MNTSPKVRTLLLGALALPLLVACQEELPLEIESTHDVLGMFIRPGDVVLVQGHTYRLEAVVLRGIDEIRPPDSDLGWTTSDPDIVRHLGNGLIEAVKPGVALIEADYRRVSAETRVRVTDATQGSSLPSDKRSEADGKERH